MISTNAYRYFLIFITIFALYQLLFFYLIRPYYLKSIYDNASQVKIPEVAFEVVYLLVLILGLAVSPTVGLSPYLLWAVIFLIYGLAIKKSKHSFFLASALLFNKFRKLAPEKQLKSQANHIFMICIISSFVFFTLNYLVL